MFWVMEQRATWHPLGWPALRRASCFPERLAPSSATALPVDLGHITFLSVPPFLCPELAVRLDRDSQARGVLRGRCQHIRVPSCQRQEAGEIHPAGVRSGGCSGAFPPRFESCSTHG